MAVEEVFAPCAGVVAAGLFFVTRGTEGNVLRGNLIGVAADGLRPLPNDIGMVVSTGPSRNVVGGPEPSHRNVISGNRQAGLMITSRYTEENVVEGNFIGLASDGAGRYRGQLDNAGEPVEISFATGEEYAITAIAGDVGGLGRLTVASRPAALAPGDRVRVSYARNVMNNGVYEIDSVSGNEVFVKDPLDDDTTGAWADFFHVITAVRYDDKPAWPIAPDGLGYSLAPKDPQAGGDPTDPAAWRASANIHGSPGADDPTPATPAAILVNEALTLAALPQVDAVELYNPTSADVDLGGWWLTDNRNEPGKWAIPPATIIPAGQYRVIREDNDGNPSNPLPAGCFGGAFGLSSQGEEVYLFSPSLIYGHGFSFGAAERGVSFGRHVISTGEEHFVAQRAVSLGTANIGPKVGPVVITEMLYCPADGGHEFVELANVTNGVVPLYDPANPSNTWNLEGVGFVFPPGVELQPGEVMLLVGDTVAPTVFRAANAVPATVRIFTFVGKLDNAGETICLQKPAPPVEGSVSYIVVDRVSYDNQAPWPTEPDGRGPSLERIAPRAYGNDPVNWKASEMAGGTPGRAEVTSHIRLPWWRLP